MTVTVPELVPEASPRTQRVVVFSCRKIFEVKESSVKKERVFHTQECKSERCCTHIVQKLCLWRTVD